MSKRRGSDDEFDPFDDLLSDDDFDTSSPLKVEDDDDILKLATEEDDDLLDEVERRGRPRRSGGGLDIGAVIGGFLGVIITAILVAVVFLLLGAGIVIGGRAVGVIPGGSVNLASLNISSLSVPTQPPAAPTSAEVAQVAQVATDAPPAVEATSAIQLPTFAPTLTPVPECNQADIDAWWALQQSNFNTFSAITPTTVTNEQNIPAYLERLRLQRDYSANIPSDFCTEYAQQSLIRFLDATMEHVRALTAAPGTSQDSLPNAEAALDSARVTMTAALWDTNVVVEPDSPVAMGIERGSAEVCGAHLWLAQVDTIRSQFMGSYHQINVAVLSPTAVRDLITSMQGSMGNMANLTVPECAMEPNRLLQQSMENRISASENLLAARTDEANNQLAEAERLEARYEAWVVWLRG